MTWESIFEEEKKKEYYKSLEQELDKKYKNTIVFPKRNDIFKAFDLTKFDDVKVIILGQDPYHGINQAQGLAFSTPSNIKNPPSMQNILKEIFNDLKKQSACLDGDLTFWAKQGILLLNTVLTVESSLPKSHRNIGWEIFTDNIIKALNNYKKNIIFLLWGKDAILKSKLINEKNHFLLTSAHPSPLSCYRGFFGCKHFSKTNDILKSLNKKEIIW